jgi:hypothetical protein
MTDGLDFVCSVCEGGNGGQICETCSGRVEGFKRWLVATNTLPQAHTRFLLVRKGKRGTLDALPLRTLYYPDRERAEERLGEMGKDGEMYEIRAVAVEYRD